MDILIVVLLLVILVVVARKIWRARHGRPMSAAARAEDSAELERWRGADTRANARAQSRARPVRGKFDIAIAYRKGDGTASERAVSVKMVRWEGGSLYVHGYCHLRGEERAFRADRIEQLLDMETGEIVADPQGWLEQRLTRKRPLPHFGAS